MADDTDRTDEVREWLAEDEPYAAMLDDLRCAFIDYVVFTDKHAAAAVTLWTAVTHALPAFECAPRLVLTSPQKRCAKSRLLDIIAGTCHDPLLSVNATVAAIYRSLDKPHPPTLIIDEADAVFGSRKLSEQHEDLRALLNAGHQRNRPALRCVGPNQKPTEFPTFSMVALAGIGSMPDTITDRAINIAMRRRKPGETVSAFRSRRDGPKLQALRAELEAWAKDHREQLRIAEPQKMPVTDRAADTWEPLIAVADAVGGHWPITARAACKELVKAAEEDDEDRSQSTKLLCDIREVFTAHRVPFLSSMELVAALRRIEDSPWGEYELTPSKLGRRLREFGIKTARNTAGTARGYRLEDFGDTFERYTRQKASEGVSFAGQA